MPKRVISMRRDIYITVEISKLKRIIEYGRVNSIHEREISVNFSIF